MKKIFNNGGVIIVKALAKRFQISPDYLSVLFKKHLGVSLAEYIRAQKLKYARALLKTGMSKKEVACYLSYSSESYLISLLKKTKS